IDMPVMLTQFMGSVFVQIQMVHDVLRHGLIHDRKDMRVCVMQGIVEVKDPDASTASRDRVYHCAQSFTIFKALNATWIQTSRSDYLALMSVPTPSSVSTSNRSACSTRPSMICTDFTPLRAASRAELILGSMPPDSVPS